MKAKKRPSLLPGCRKLSRYLEEEELSISRFARENKLDFSEVAKLLRGEKRRITVQFAADIERATGGRVEWREWIPK